MAGSGKAFDEDGSGVAARKVDGDQSQPQTAWARLYYPPMALDTA
jgi:hypothetical protein